MPFHSLPKQIAVNNFNLAEIHKLNKEIEIIAAAGNAPANSKSVPVDALCKSAVDKIQEISDFVTNEENLQRLAPFSNDCLAFQRACTAIKGSYLDLQNAFQSGSEQEINVMFAVCVKSLQEFSASLEVCQNDIAHISNLQQGFAKNIFDCVCSLYQGHSLSPAAKQQLEVVCAKLEPRSPMELERLYRDNGRKLPDVNSDLALKARLKDAFENAPITEDNYEALTGLLSASLTKIESKVYEHLVGLTGDAKPTKAVLSLLKNIAAVYTSTDGSLDPQKIKLISMAQNIAKAGDGSKIDIKDLLASSAVNLARNIPIVSQISALVAQLGDSSSVSLKDYLSFKDGKVYLTADPLKVLPLNIVAESREGGFNLGILERLIKEDPICSKQDASLRQQCAFSVIQTTPQGAINSSFGVLRWLLGEAKLCLGKYVDSAYAATDKNIANNQATKLGFSNLTIIMKRLFPEPPQDLESNPMKVMAISCSCGLAAMIGGWAFSASPTFFAGGAALFTFGPAMYLLLKAEKIRAGLISKLPFGELTLAELTARISAKDYCKKALPQASGFLDGLETARSSALELAPKLSPFWSMMQKLGSAADDRALISLLSNPLE